MSKPEEHSVTNWIAAVRNGDETAARELWNRYFTSLMRLARSRMATLPRSVYDEEDAALSTFNVLCVTLRKGRYPALGDREELWNLMLTVLMRKIGRRVDYEFSDKRTPQVIEVAAETEASQGALSSSDPVAAECQHLLEVLKDPNLERVAIWKLEGYTDNDIAEKLGRTRRTVQRMLSLIREVWKQQLDTQ